MLLRFKLFSFGLIAVFALLIARLFYWQIVKGKELSEKARSQYQGGYSIEARRGSILASDGTWLATSGKAYLVYASVPDLNENSKKIAEKLAPLFVDDANDHTLLLNEIDRIEKLLTKKDAVWIPLKHKVAPEIESKIKKLGLDGLGFEEEERRIYPEASSAAQLMGFVGKDNEGMDEGYFGIEGFYNLPLSGKPGFFSREKDARGLPILLGSANEISAIEGVDLLTHIDKTIQLDIDKKLLEGIRKYGALGGTAIVMNPKDGGILAMSSYPSYDPVKYSEFSNEVFKNPAISDSFEPGSVFKIIVMASALDAGVISPETQCDICRGPVQIDKYQIETWNQKYYPDSSMTDVIVHSDNVGMVFVAQKLGVDKLYGYIENFGFGSPTGIDLQGEASPRLRDKKDWGTVDLAVAGFGQGIAVTPIQMIQGASVIANKGIMVTPQVVDKIISDDKEEDIKPVRGKRVISEKAAREITSMMVEAAKSGESKWTNTPGFKVAGKTGTAQIPISGHYDEEKTIASFVGFAPYDDPKFIMLITLREPTTSPWASETAAPLWYSIARDLFIYFGMQPAE